MKQDFDANINFTNVRDKRDPNGSRYSGKGRIYGQLNDDGSVSMALIECPVGTTAGNWGELAGYKYVQIRLLASDIKLVKKDEQGCYRLHSPNPV